MAIGIAVSEMVLVCLVIPQRPSNQNGMQLYGWEPLKVSHHPAKFGGLDTVLVVI